VRDYAQAQGLDEKAALAAGMEEKKVEFVRSGGELYRPA
jgi:phosphomethylpyrimidine synthase